MVDRQGGSLVDAAARVHGLAELAALLRGLRRRHARSRQDGELSYRDLAGRTGWSATSVAEYFTGRTLPPTDRLDDLLTVLGAEPDELRALATARDRIDEQRRTGRHHTPEVVGLDDGVTPRQLPPAVRHFGGRRRELAALTALARETPAAGTAVVVVVAGTAGVGKTALAVHWAHQVADRYADGQLYVDLRGFDPVGVPVETAVAVRRFLGALGVPPQRVPADPDAQVALFRSLLAGRRFLILVDNARDAAQVRPLLPAAPGCLVLVTSRNRLSGLVAAEGAHLLALDLLSVAEAREVLADRIGAARVAAEPAAVDDIVSRCARLPLALAVVAARATTHPDLPLAVVTRDLADWGALADGDPHLDVRAVFSWSYDAVTPAAARLFRLLSLHPGPDLTVAAAAAVLTLAAAAAVEPSRTRALLAELAAAGLVVEHRPGRYTCHDLLRAYAASLTTADDRTAADRMLAYYLHAAADADRLLAAGDAQALAWFTAEHAVLLGVVRHAAAAGRHQQVGQLAQVLAVFLDRQGHWHDGIAVWLTAAASAALAGDGAAEARGHRELARACTRLYRFDDAREHLDRALRTATGDLVEQGHAYHQLAILCERRGDIGEALEHSREALARYRAAGDRHGQARAYNAVGWHLTLLGEHREALGYCGQALTLLSALGDRAAQSHTWDSLGHAHLHLGDHGQAATCFERALDLQRALGDRHSEAEALDHLGDVRHAAGEHAAAETCWRQALGVLTALGHPDAARVRTKLASPTGRAVVFGDVRP